MSLIFQFIYNLHTGVRTHVEQTENASCRDAEAPT